MNAPNCKSRKSRTKVIGIAAFLVGLIYAMFEGATSGWFHSFAHQKALPHESEPLNQIPEQPVVNLRVNNGVEVPGSHNSFGDIFVGSNQSTERSLLITQNVELESAIEALSPTFGKESTLKTLRSIRRLLAAESEAEQIELLRKKQDVCRAWLERHLGHHDTADAILENCDVPEAIPLKADSKTWLRNATEAETLLSNNWRESPANTLAMIRTVLVQLDESDQAQLRELLSFWIPQTRELMSTLRQNNDPQSQLFLVDACGYQGMLLSRWLNESSSDGIITRAEAMAYATEQEDSVAECLKEGELLISESDSVISRLGQQLVAISDRTSIGCVSRASCWYSEAAFAVSSLGGEYHRNLARYNELTAKCDTKLQEMLDRFTAAHGVEGVLEQAQLYRQIAARSFERGDLTTALGQIEHLRACVDAAEREGHFLDEVESDRMSATEGAIHLRFLLQEKGKSPTKQILNEIKVWADQLYSFHESFPYVRSDLVSAYGILTSEESKAQGFLDQKESQVKLVTLKTAH